ncbi:pyridoxal phosphate-dependent transferase [Gymnopilus junonius]|uniref:Pyridoxal phosphate-dependent transferase n=1 Tax=Gymnopilus junonius TaxID=109634 RepID=A0A9P5NIJ1_GYMJU|nr:pyridoxal phosphate-dependent transferase [Gymnopilus junonius]
MDIEQFRKAGYQAIDRICDYYYSLQDRDVVPRVEPGYLREHIPLQPPEEGEDFQVIADDYQKFILPGLTHWQHPSFFAYFPTACTFEGLLGDLYAGSISNPGFNWSSSPACTELEGIVMDWAANLLGLSPAFHNASGVGGGVLQTTASDSALVAVVAARSNYQREHPEVKMEDLVIYTTSQTHSLGAKAGLVLGLQVRSIDVKLEDQLSMRGNALREALEEDKQLGRKPFILIATVGTTSTGAVDNMPEIREVAKDHPSLWIHVDAAWAGMALACPENRSKLYLDDINSFAHSFCANFHKWGLVNFDCSTLWVRDRRNLTEALDITPVFLRTKQGDAGTVIDYRNWHLALGRRFRSLKLWFVLRGFGVQGFQKYIRRCIELNQQFVNLIEFSEDLSLATQPSLALTVFRVVPKPRSPEQATPSAESLNDLNRIFYGRLSARHDIMLTQTSLNGMFCVRLAVGAARTTEEHIRNAYNIVEKEAKAAIETWDQTINGVAIVG